MWSTGDAFKVVPCFAVVVPDAAVFHSPFFRVDAQSHRCSCATRTRCAASATRARRGLHLGVASTTTTVVVKIPSSLRCRIRAPLSAPAASPHFAMASSAKAHEHHGDGLAITPPKTFIDNVIDSIVTPGASSGLVATINGALILLLLTLAAMGINGSADMHALVLGFLALGLLGSLNYYISLVRSAELEAPTAVAEPPQPSNRSRADKDA